MLHCLLSVLGLCVGYSYCYQKCYFYNFPCLFEYCTALNLSYRTYTGSKKLIPHNNTEMFITILITDKNLLQFEVSKLGQILGVDKTGFLRPSHIYMCVCIAHTHTHTHKHTHIHIYTHTHKHTLTSNRFLALYQHLNQ